MGKSAQTLSERFPPSEPCSCEVCRGYCARPGWWSVEQARCALGAGLGSRMMLELSPERGIGVLSPAFKGCEGGVAFKEYSNNGCCFFRRGLCELFGTGHEPLECRFCHHERKGRGAECHEALESDWNTPAGQALVLTWICGAAGAKNTDMINKSYL